MDRNIFIILLLLIVLMVSACFDEKDSVYNGPATIEFSGMKYPGLAKSVSQSAGEDKLEVQLVSPQQSTTLTLSYVIDPASTAVEGVHYSLPDKGQFAIPAEESFGYISIQLLPGIPEGNAGEKRTVIFVLAGAPSVLPSENYKKLTYTITF